MKFRLLQRRTPAPPAIRPEGQHRRYRMELDLRAASLPTAIAPPDFHWLPWRPRLAAMHAIVLFEGFRGGLDSQLLPSLSDVNSCSELIRQTIQHHRFIAEGTWLLVTGGSHPDTCVPCGAIQGLGAPGGIARIQNLAVLEEFRGRGLGRALLLKSLRNFRWLGFERAQLDVTESNTAAVQLYRSLGFRVRRAFFRHEA